jgi:hypothetical protein
VTILRARFDGRVLVPEEPVDLPRGPVLEVQVREMHERPAATMGGSENGLPVFELPAGAAPITSEDVARGEDEP